MPLAKSGINPTLDSASKKYVIYFDQFKIETRAIGVFLARIRVINILEC